MLSQTFSQPAETHADERAHDFLQNHKKYQSWQPIAHSLAAAGKTCGQWRREAESFAAGGRTHITLGIGGSHLSSAIYEPFRRAAARIIRINTLDSEALAALAENDDLAASRIVIASKSGETRETLALFLALAEIHRRRGEEKALPQRVRVIAGRNTPMTQLAAHYQIPCLHVAAEPGSRFSAFTPLGLFPALMHGLDSLALLAGAQEVLAQLAESAQTAQSRALADGAGWLAGSSVHVLLIHDRALRGFALWWRQIIAESLGKNHRGILPVIADCPPDQHSQFQFYLDGIQPAGAAKPIRFTSVVWPQSGTDMPLAPHTLPELAEGVSLNHIARAAAQAGEQALEEAGLALRRLVLAERSEYAFGALLMHCLLEVFAAAHQLEVEPAGQPAISAGRALLARLTARG